jgi:RNA polymerase sigma factor (sigma-70 family)
MTTGPSNRDLVARWQQGDQRAAQVLVDRYLVRLTALARSRLSRKLARRLDAEDVVLSAWRSFFVATGRGRVTVPGDDNLWPILVTLTLRKLSRQAGRHQSERLDVDRDHSLSECHGWPTAVADDPSPAEAAALLDELEFLLAQLSPQDREIVSRRLRGDHPHEIAAEIGCSERTVRRAMQRFRSLAAARESEGTDTEGIRHSSPKHAQPRESNLRHPDPAPDSFYEGMQPTIAAGDVLLQEMIGQGGFGKVYRAFDRRHDRTVAVKFLRKSLWTDTRAVECLLRETQLVSKLSHKSIIRHHGWDRTASGAVFVVMDWIDGLDLLEVIRRRTIPIQDVVRYGLAIADALKSAHAAGVVHGDLSPSNVLLGGDDRVVLTDFGFARTKSQPGATPAGGTPGHLAPEQVSEAFGEIEQRTDVYGLGGLLYAMCTGQPPSSGTDVADILANVLSSRPPRAPRFTRGQIPRALEQIIMDCLQKEPTLRPNVIGEVKTRLKAVSSTVDSPTTERDNS